MYDGKYVKVSDTAIMQYCKVVTESNRYWLLNWY